jgi:predicted small integral membrane protein
MGCDSCGGKGKKKDDVTVPIQALKQPPLSEAAISAIVLSSCLVGAIIIVGGYEILSRRGK